jgi:hypothetical protein
MFLKLHMKTPVSRGTGVFAENVGEFSLNPQFILLILSQSFHVVAE